MPNTSLNVKKQTSIAILIKSLFIISIIIGCFGYFKTHTAADTDTEQSIITATMPDVQAPSEPILISPEDEALLNIDLFEFVWQESTDNVAVSYYQFYLDGILLFDNIPLVDDDNAEYTLTYDSDTGYYHLMPKTALLEGFHTWQIVVFDTADNSAKSEIWSFTIDITPPEFTLTNIGDAEVLISATDPVTIPEEPVILADNEPLLIATGEALSLAECTLTIPDDPNQSFSETIDLLGDWEYQLGILPRDVIMTLDCIITDLTANSSYLTGVQFLIKTQHFLPDVATLTPTPEIRIPLISLREIIIQAIQELLERIPEPLLELIDSLPDWFKEPIKQAAKALAPILNVVIVAIPIAIAIISLLSKFRGQLSFKLLLKILQALGLLPSKDPRGLVFDSNTYKGIPFAKINITGVTRCQQIPISEVFITNNLGVYQGIQIPSGKYTISVSHADFKFPTEKRRPFDLDYKSYYKGEEFSIELFNDLDFFMIPMDALNPKNIFSLVTRFRLLISRFINLSGKLGYLLFFITGVLVIVFPTLWNYTVFGIYCLSLLNRFKRKLQPASISGQVLDEKQIPVSNAVVKLWMLEESSVASMAVADEKGKFAFHDKKGRYQILAIKSGFTLKEIEPAMTLNEVDSRDANIKIELIMQEVEELL